MTWRDEAACQGMSTDMFFANEARNGQKQARLVTLSLQVCATCPVQRECLLDALSEPEQHGVRGGYTASDRARMKRVVA